MDRFVVGKNSGNRLPSCLFPDQIVSTIKGLPFVWQAPCSNLHVFLFRGFSHSLQTNGEDVP